ncbi:uncharacterized protein [Periplaneta americana]|uniref:uncharacterized protein isoform X2 n=1 Tax=Periplaneta americana TaxID=6978 RepID=UPI0037E9C284
MLIKMLPLLCLTLFAGAIFTSSNGCDIGPVTFTNFDFNKFNGPWTWLYHTKTDVDSSLGCIKDDFIPQGDESDSTTVAYNRVQKSNQDFKGFVKEWNSTSYFHDFYDVSVPWRTNFFIMGIDYTKYVVLKGCLVGEDSPHIYIGFRETNPKEDAIEAANKTLQENGMSLKDLGRFSDCDEM